ncbi:MAG: Thiol-disulfide oxidoreductase ResA [Bacteroidia bacterium]|nr:Thiol-disulfide oxidoreductase ResA [Bacteroidia bacterium]
MKKHLQQFLASLLFLLLLIGQNANAQLPTGSIAPDFTATDINGNTWNLYDLLDQGKTVLIDFSAAWCGPCWGYHSMGAMKDIWNHHGPSGTISQDMFCIFVESESTNTLAQLQGVDAGNTYATESQGDFITGEPYPFIETNGANIANQFNASSMPTIFVICPDRSVTEIYWENATETNVLALRNECSFSTTTLDAGIMNPDVLNPLLIDCDNVDVSARICNYGSVPLTSATVEYVVNGSVQDSYSWTGNLNTYESAAITNGGTVTGPDGDNTVTIRVTNPNNGSDLVSSNNSQDVDFHIYETTGGGGFSNDYEAGDMTPNGWHLLNDPDGADTWFVTGSVGYNSDNSSVLTFFYIPPGRTFELYAPEINLTTFNTPVLEFDVAHATYSSSTTDRLQVMAMTCAGNWVTLYDKQGSTTPNVGNSLSTVPTETSQFVPSSDSEWRHDLVSLEQFSNEQSVIIKFVATSDYGNTLLVDNINIRNSGVGIQEDVAAVGLQVYPNPFSNQTNVFYNVDGMENVNVRIVNITGQEVYSNDFGMQTSGQHNFQINAENFAAGMYVMNLNIGNKTVSYKLSVTK